MLHISGYYEATSQQPVSKAGSTFKRSTFHELLVIKSEIILGLVWVKILFVKHLLVVERVGRAR